MKKHLSVFGLFARSSIYRVLGVMLMMGIAEAGLFWFKLQKALTDYNNPQAETEFGRVQELLHFEEIIDRSHIPLCFAVAFVLITILLCLPGTEYQSKTGYTLRRLSIKEGHVFLHQAAYNIVVYVILWAVQVLICFGLACFYTTQIPAELVGNQTIFLAFYRNEFLHSLLPLSEAGLWLRNIFLVIGLGVASAEFPYKQRRKGFGAAIVVLGLFAFLNFRIGIGSFSSIFFTIIVVAIYAGNAIYNVFRKEEQDEE